MWSAESIRETPDSGVFSFHVNESGGEAYEKRIRGGSPVHGGDGNVRLFVDGLCNGDPCAPVSLVTSYKSNGRPNACMQSWACFNGGPDGFYAVLSSVSKTGHLYQTVYFSASEPDPIRSILDFGGYVEGWATYAEMMSYYLAPLPKTEASLLQKNSSVILGLYALADMGIHYDGWSVTDTVRFFSDYGINDPNAVQSVYKLIIGSPANYLKYYIGYLKFYELKKEMADALGNQFSQKEFHRAVLDVGPAPFEIVYDEVEKNLLN